MIGNDIVDLELARKESNWKRKGFFDKIFTDKEQLLINNADNPEVMVWNLWSRKEAAYKIYNRQTGIRGYFPLQIECSFENETVGTVFCKGFCYYTQTQISDQKIHSIATTKVTDFKRVFLLDSNARIKKIKEIPYYIDPTNDTERPVSISHHGRYRVCVIIR
jgi:phosphopantetheinyl transferase (holo-ACP synthase)